MLPIPFVNYIPSFFNRDAKLIALSDKIDSNLEEWKSDILELNTIIDPAKIDSQLLNDMGDYLSAGILARDSDRTKREKISNAIQSHKFRGTWAFDIKPTIDAIVGGDAILYTGLEDSSDGILLGQEATDPDMYWGTIGIDGIDGDLGFDIIGDFTEIEIAGIFEIDVGSSDTTTYTKVTSDGFTKVTSDAKTKVSFTLNVPDLILALEDKIPIYFRVYLGYIQGGEFTRFANGQIN